MRRSCGWFGLVVLVVMFGLAAGGCSSQQPGATKTTASDDTGTKKALDLVAASNKHYEAYRRLRGEIAGLEEKRNSTSSSREGEAHAKYITEKIGGKMRQQRTELLAAIRVLEKGESLNVSSDFSKYFKLLADSHEKRVKATDAFSKLNRTWAKLYDPKFAEKTTEAEMKAEYIKWNTLGSELDYEATGIKKKADAFFKQRGLGKP